MYNIILLPFPLHYSSLSFLLPLSSIFSFPVRLEWDVDGMEDDLQESKSNLTSLISDSDLVVITTYGKSVPKKCSLSPDGWFQVRYIATCAFTFST